MELTSVQQLRAAFYRLVGVEADDEGLSKHGEADDDVAHLYLTRGARAAQLYLLDAGYEGWRKRSSALSSSGPDSADGGRYADLPADFLRAWGAEYRSALEEPDGTPWGAELRETDSRRVGSGYYLRGDKLWVTRGAVLPTTLHLVYHYKHPVIDGNLADADIDFPVDARWLIVAEAADRAKDESWLPGGPEHEAKIERALLRARREARDYARRSRTPRRFRKPLRAGNHW